ncbi:peptide chain release factor N(5)-glutamine methyltransferase [Polymorphum gilvum]|uniref:Release factor glutamine methyltransferase n=1 Tax=Polymorphum gilvum (strain LMG 25793 / CGMCC 1.9160 / SL003B-26A1) TaxID=991905 RepID=F2J341_POLGS|nr:peptide chain release factor N(5)-glutamine methyltransferase [Polymorphum gilvum]ADZ68911.1 Protein-(Glutamine-N5) methyltransferase, release factor-specific [Polymorphum gilvum SL003B-26A1]
MKLGALYRELRDALRRAGVDTPELDARMLTADAAGLSPGDIVLREDAEVDPAREALARAHVAARCGGTPVGRILGRREFWGLELSLSPATLEPRPDTETLVEAVLARAGGEAAPVLADIGTGSGAIAIAVLTALPEACAVATDISLEALATARANALRHGVDGRMLFVQGSYGAPLGAGFDWIVSNPPYIASAEVDRLAREVREHDPRRALDGGADGLDAYRAIVPAARHSLRPGGRLAVEIGADQGAEVAELMAENGFFDVEIIRDLAGRPRVVSGCRAR